MVESWHALLTKAAMLRSQGLLIIALSAVAYLYVDTTLLMVFFHSAKSLLALQTGVGFLKILNSAQILAIWFS